MVPDEKQRYRSAMHVMLALKKSGFIINISNFYLVFDQVSVVENYF